MNRRQFLLGAALLAVTPTRRRRPPLLPLDSRPPDFTLSNEDGRSITSAPFFGHKRVVLLFVPQAHEAQGRAYMGEAERDAAQFAERDLVVLVIAAPGALADTRPAPPVTVLYDTREKMGCMYEADADAVAFYLVGKDGTLKMARHGYPSNRELFATVDAMPMRRQEMRQREK